MAGDLGRKDQIPQLDPKPLRDLGIRFDPDVGSGVSLTDQRPPGSVLGEGPGDQDDPGRPGAALDRLSGAHPHGSLDPGYGQIGKDRGSGRTPGARRLDRQAPPVRSLAPIAPQSPRQVSHLRLFGESLRQGEGPPGVADQDGLG